jgi:cell division protein FtsA
MKKRLSFAAAGPDPIARSYDPEALADVLAEPAPSRPPLAARARRDTRNLIIGLDIGTSKVVAVVAELTPDGRLDVIGMGSHDSKGLKKGVVVNIEATVSAIQRALEEAELMADCKIQRVYTGIAGSHIRSFNSTGMVAVKDKEVTPVDIDRAIETARAMPIPTDQQVLHILTQEFLVDGQDGIREPLGMSGVRLEVKVHIVTGAVSAAQNIVKCVRRCGLDVSDLILQPLASSIAVLSDDEKELGVALVDIGGGTTDVAIFREGAIRHTAVIPIAGDQVTNDIAMALRTPTPEAELIKLRHGCALRQLADPDEMIDVPGLGDRPPRQLSRQTLAEVIEPRVEELFTLVQQVLRQSGFEELLSSGIVLTGGSALMQGMVELGEEIFHMPVRLGVPRYAGGLQDVVQSPRYATAVGLLLEGRQQFERGVLARQTGGFRVTLRRMREWFQHNF